MGAEIGMSAPEAGFEAIGRESPDFLLRYGKQIHGRFAMSPVLETLTHTHTGGGLNAYFGRLKRQTRSLILLCPDWLR